MRKYNLIFTDENKRVLDIRTVNSSSLPDVFESSLRPDEKNVTCFLYLTTYLHGHLVSKGYAACGFLVDFSRVSRRVDVRLEKFDLEDGSSACFLKEVDL